jgi:methylthioribose-1-phosphate isomerase
MSRRSISHEEKIKLLEPFEKLLVGDYATALRVNGGKVELLDQRRIPAEEIWLPCDTVEQMYIYIKRLSTRGAPLIGCSAAIALAVHTINKFPNDPKIPETADYLRSSRPTAVNLMYACDLIAQKKQNFA